MKNSKNRNILAAEYIKDGWEPLGGNLYKKGNTTRDLPPDGEYDPWLPLPVDASTQLFEHDKNVKLAIECNASIAAGNINVVINGNIPSAWIDHAGLARNKNIMDKAKAAAIATLKAKYAGKIYTREGCRFVRI